MLAGTVVSTETVTQISSPTTSAYNDWRKEKQELEDQIQKQAMQIQRQDEQIEKIQVVLEAKITRSHELEEQLARHLTWHIAEIPATKKCWRNLKC